FREEKGKMLQYVLSQVKLRLNENFESANY
ncbi:unnamed protein product, partial [Allacma fusca]